MLFVDDDANVLRSMTRLLRSEAEDWAIVFAGSGTEAIEHLEQQDFELVVSDFHMPSVTGDAVLASAARLQPAALRVLLSATDVTAAEVHAHRVISKPVDPNAFRTFLRGIAGSSV